MSNSKLRSVVAACCGLVMGFAPFSNTLSAIPQKYSGISPIVKSQAEKKADHEVFGFAPYWTINKLENVNFDVLTTLAYFDLPITAEGHIDREAYGYEVFKSERATALFKKAHENGTRVVATVTQMDNDLIDALMDNPEGQAIAIAEIVSEVKNRGIDGVNIDFEYVGDPGEESRNKFSIFVNNLSQAMHSAVPGSKVTVSVYASSVKEPKIYNIGHLAQITDGIFMMAYDFATASSDNAIPTSPLYGHKSGEYWYDVATAVDDFLAQMPADKLILGVPWYGYDYMVYEPSVMAETRPNTWRGRSKAQTYDIVQNEISADGAGTSGFKSGWDEDGKVGWKAYYVEESGTWRMVFYDDVRSLSFKYDFAKEKGLQGVGMWALGFDSGRNEMWELLASKFGPKLADRRANQRIVSQNTEGVKVKN